MPATCRVAALLPKIDRAVARFNELDAMSEKRGRGGLTWPQLRRRQTAAWRRLRQLEADAMLTEAQSELGVTLQLVLALPEAVSLHCWTIHDPMSMAVSSRLRGALRSALLTRDLSVLDPETVQFYCGRLDRRPQAKVLEKRAKRTRGVSSRETRRAVRRR